MRLVQVEEVMPMAKPTLTRSAALPVRMGAFGLLFSTLCVSFEPMPAFALTLAATAWLAKV